MRLDETLKGVAQKPGSTHSRIQLAAILQHLQIPGAVKVWEAAALVAAAKGDFFNALAIIRLHLPGEMQGPLLTEIIKHYMATPSPQDQPPPPSPRPFPLQLPSDPRGVLQIALKLGTALPGIYLSTHLQMPELPIFGDLPESLLILLAQNMIPIPLKTGDILLRQGDKERACYLLTHGKLRVLKEAPNRKPTELARLTAPTLIGEISLLTSTSRRATIVASSNGMAWRIDPPLLEHLGRLHNTLIPQIRTLIRMRLVKNLMQSEDVFSRLDDKEKFNLLQAFAMHEIEPGREVIRRGERVAGLFVNMHGEVIVEMRMHDGRPREVAKLSEGSIFGGPSFFSGEASRTTIRMPEGGLLLQLTPPAYQNLCQKFPQLDHKLRQQNYPY